MLRLIATIIVAAVVGVGIWLPASTSGATPEGAETTVADGTSSSESDTMPMQPDASGGHFCQKQCPCLGNAIDCSKKNLKTLFHLPHWVENLELASNRLTHDVIEAQLSDLSKLQVLNLNHNRMTRLPVLRGLRNLIKLYVTGNEIDTIDVEAIAALPALKFLDLSRNAIQELPYTAFPNRNSLQYLNLNFNKLTLLAKGTFDRLASLKRLEISSNALEEVQSLTFQNLNQLKSLKLNNNRIPALMDGVFHGLTTIGLLELNNNTIRSIRKGGLFNLTSLTTLALARNAIVEIEHSGWEFTPKLVSLDLSYNQLRSLDRYTFEELSGLKTLLLQGNSIAAIGEGTFNETRALETLYLNENRISWTIEDMRGPFLGLGKLERLYLNANEIKSVSRNAFLGLKSLTQLELSQNNISSIQNNAFKDTVRLKNLIMNSTNLLCDCNLAWFYHWIKERKEVFQIDAECIYPIWLRNRLIRDLHAANFSCYDSPKPHLIDEPQSQLGIRGTNVVLVCRATSTAADRMTFKWKQDNLELPETQYTVDQNDTENGTIGSSVLTIPNIEQSGAGKYQCIITNTYGVVYSQKVKVTVGTYPKFRKTPTDVSVLEGKVARLDCDAAGDPKPQISWEKDGGNDFPAAKERRMRVIPHENAFLILNARPIDTGVYSCTAENPAGVIRANASVVVWDTPLILRRGSESSAMDSLLIPIGQPSVLRCKASPLSVAGGGSGTVPKPANVFWLKDGEPVALSGGRHFVTDEGLLLLIVDTELADAGLYECRLESEFGSETGSTRLVVVEGPEDMHGSVLGDGGYGGASGGSLAEENATGPFDWMKDSTVQMVAVLVLVCVLLVLVVWLIRMYRMEKRLLRGAGVSEDGEFDLATGMEINQPNLIVRSGVGTSTTPAGYFEYLIPMVANGGGSLTTNVDEEDVEGRSRSMGRDPRFFTKVVAKTNARSTELDSDDLDDDLSSKDSGTGGDCASATGSTNAAHRGSREDLKCLLHSLTRKHASDLELEHQRHLSPDDAHDPDSDPRLEPPPPIPPINATTAVLMMGSSTIGPASTRHHANDPGDDQHMLPPAALVAARMPTSQTFPAFVPSSAGGDGALKTTSLESSADPVLPPKKSSSRHQQQQHKQQIQVNQLYQLLLENPRLVEKPAKYRTKSMERSIDEYGAPTSTVSSGFGTGSSTGSTLTGGDRAYGRHSMTMGDLNR
ncbi:leucine-rich repeats and immunoglobulin-like domains protein 3 [Anopheles bellator]|uniref:leucine-rich repeats and immunoglobulin-like domains protein 3 n=1 Tax=Anopheles bellator TaxID=139047 RepID=UPI002649B089|nr:leucine-rich repeats and immunoglobulin-like domains protein 3 [Anopheles bellator]